MAKTISCLILAALLVYPANLESGQLFLKMGLGLCQSGKLEDSWLIIPIHYDFEITDPIGIPPGYDVTLELMYKFHRNFGVSLGTGSIWQKAGGRTCLCSPFADEYPLGDIEFTPVISTEIIPVYLTGVFFLPISSFVQLNIFGGIGYYFGNLATHKAVEEDEGAENPLREKNRLVWKYEYNGQAVGVHAGIGADLALMPPLFLSLEFLYRKAEFKDFKTSFQQIRGIGWGPFFAHQMNETGEQWGGDSTFLYAQKIKIEDSQRDIDYSVARYDSSGFIMRVGVKFRF
jgi:hypothetical protein